MDDFRLYWELFGWFWKLLPRPDFVLCFVIGAELIFGESSAQGSEQVLSAVSELCQNPICFGR